MKKWLLPILLMISFSFALEVNVTPSTKLEKDHAYVISAIGLSGSGTVNYISGDSTISSGGTYKLAPQVIIYDGTTKFVGTATNFTGCLNNVKYVDSAPSGGCGIVKVNNISAENIKAGVKVSYGLEGNTLTEITGTFTSDANATAGQILSGQTAYVNGSKVTGTMANQGAKTASLNAGGSYTIPAGYHNGSGNVTANSLKSQTSATAGAGQILSGYTAWVDGTKITGTIPSLGTQTITPGTSNKTIAAGNYLSGTQTIAGDGDLVAGNIKSGVNIFGVTGNYTGGVSSGSLIYGPRHATGYNNASGLSGSFGSNYKLVVCVMSLGGHQNDTWTSAGSSGFDGAYISSAYTTDERRVHHIIAWKANYTAGTSLSIWGGYNTNTTCHGFN